MIRRCLAAFPLVIAPLVTGGADSRAHAQSVEAVAVPPEVLDERSGWRLTYDHVTGKLELVDARHRAVAAWSDMSPAGGPAQLARVPPDRAVEFTIVNANTLLYQYEIEAVPLSGRPVVPCGSVGRSFAESGFLVSTRALLGQDRTLPALGAMVQEGSAALQAPPVATFGFETSSSGRAAQLEAAEAATRDYAALVSTLDRLASTLDDSLALIARLADREPVDGLLAGLQATLERQHPGLSDPRQIGALVVGRYRGVRSAVAPLMRPLSVFDSVALRAAMLDEELGATFARGLDAAERLQPLLVEIGRARTAARRTVVLPASAVPRRIALRVLPAAGREQVPRPLVGDVVVYTRPLLRTICQLSLGVTWMRPPRRYEQESDGTLIDGSRRDEFRTSVALMFHVHSRSFPVVAGLGGVGLGAASGMPDLYAGGSLRLLEPSLVNIGVVWQREQRLPAGVTLGDRLADPVVLRNLERHYRPALFMGVSLGR